MTLEIGDFVCVKDIVGDATSIAIVAGWYYRPNDQYDYTGRFVIATKGRYYSVRYGEGLGIYNTHESRIQKLNK